MDFADPTFLFAGDQTSLSSLVELLRTLPQKELITLQDIPTFSAFSNEKLLLRLVDTREGMRLTRENVFEWCLTKEGISKFSDQIQEVINNEKPCHDYLDSEHDEVVVIVSKDEYPDTWPSGH